MSSVLAVQTHRNTLINSPCEICDAVFEIMMCDLHYVRFVLEDSDSRTGFKFSRRVTETVLF